VQLVWLFGLPAAQIFMDRLLRPNKLKRKRLSPRITLLVMNSNRIGVVRSRKSDLNSKKT